MMIRKSDSDYEIGRLNRIDRLTLEGVERFKLLFKRATALIGSRSFVFVMPVPADSNSSFVLRVSASNRDIICRATRTNSLSSRIAFVLTHDDVVVDHTTNEHDELCHCLQFIFLTTELAFPVLELENIRVFENDEGIDVNVIHSSDFGYFSFSTDQEENVTKLSISLKNRKFVYNCYSDGKFCRPEDIYRMDTYQRSAIHIANKSFEMLTKILPLIIWEIPYLPNIALSNKV